MQTNETVFIYNNPIHVLATSGHLQGGNTKDKKLKYGTIIEVIKPIHDIKSYIYISWIGFVISMIVSSFNFLSFVSPP